MMKTTALHLALIGDYNPDVIAHQAIPIALQQAAEALGEKLRLEDGPNMAVDVIEETLAAHGRKIPRDYHLLGAASRPPTIPATSLPR